MGITLHVDIVSAETAIYSGAAVMVYAPAVMGEVGIAPRHAPLITRLKPGEVRIEKADGEVENVYVSGGILEVQPHVVTILADTAIRAHDLDEAAVLEAKKAAEDALANQESKFEVAQAQAQLAEVAAQLQAIQRLRKK